jgi:hypothetical protein
MKSVRLLVRPNRVALHSLIAGQRLASPAALINRFVALVAGLWIVSGTALAWVYPEHRDIAVLSVAGMDPEHRAVFDQLWNTARVGQEKRLCKDGADAAQGLDPQCIDWAAMSAIAGDHSCSSQGLLDAVENAPWILEVADVAAQLKVDLAKSAAASPAPATPSTGAISDLRRQLESESARAQRINALRVADTRLQGVDPEYATRAGSNNAHFLLPRPSTDSSARDYFLAALKPGSEINAVGVYAWYHLTALQKASRLAHEQLSAADRSALTRAMLADEAFALHFMEDVFAAGHVAGTWGDVSQRKGTHDYYNENGLEVTTWLGEAKTMVLLGDAHMRPEDAARAAADVRLSLEQVLNVAAGAGGSTFPYTPKAPSQPGAFDVCKNNTLLARSEELKASPEAVALGVEVLKPMPVPGLGQGLGALPRYRSELGRFIGAAGSLDVRHIDGGFTGLEQGTGFITGADLSARVGLGLDGVLGEAGDGLVFLSLGYRGDSSSTNKFSNGSVAQQAGSLSSAIPARSGLSARLRMPFYLLPGDLLLLAPLYFISPKTYQNMGVTAVNGGLIPWQLGWATPVGRFQFVLGREIGVAFYGLQDDTSLLAPGATSGASPRIISFKSTYFDFPIAEYRPYRAFDTKQTSELRFQLYYGIDYPYGAKVIYPADAPGVGLHRVQSIGLRVVFDWRHYY